MIGIDEKRACGRVKAAWVMAGRVSNATRCCAFVAVMAVGMVADAAGSELRLMTFNIKGDAARFFQDRSDPLRSWIYDDGSNPNGPSGPHRRERAVAVISEFDPDIMSVQELKNNQRIDFERMLTHFGYYGEGREGGTLGDRNGIYYRASRFTRLDEGDFWLSETPETPGTTFVGNGGDTGNPRMATWVKLLDGETGAVYFVLSTHWSLDSAARRDSARLIQDMLPELSGGLPVILMGDLNATQSSSAYRTLKGMDSASDVQLTDSFVEAGGVDGRTFHNWAGGVSGTRIDHIFHEPGAFLATDADIVRTRYDSNRLPSDHYPVTATLTVLVPEPGGCSLLLMGVLALFRARCARRR